MERMIPPSTGDLLGSTVGEELDRLEVIVGKIGLNSSQNALQVLYGLDSVYKKINDLDQTSQSYKTAFTQFQSVLARLDKDAPGFLKDLGGRHQLVEERARINPEPERYWWYLDERLAQRRRASFNRSMITGGIILGVLVVIALVYHFFLAPPPEVTARYGHEQAARDELMYGNYEVALDEVDNGLSYVPEDGNMLALKGVILEQSGDPVQAQEIFIRAQNNFSKPEDFYVARGQVYITANQPDKALADALEAQRLNPDSVQAYLLSGQAYEIQKAYKNALDEYDRAFAAAEISKQYELQALARMRMAMLMQSLGADISTTESVPTLTPEP